MNPPWKIPYLRAQVVVFFSLAARWMSAKEKIQVVTGVSDRSNS
jgi:hypothetical protein